MQHLSVAPSLPEVQLAMQPAGQAAAQLVTQQQLWWIGQQQQQQQQQIWRSSAVTFKNQSRGELSIPGDLGCSSTHTPQPGRQCMLPGWEDCCQGVLLAHFISPHHSRLRST
jgi:hypothetical protein